MGTVSFEVPGPGTYQVQCDPSLTPLANAGTAGDVLAGKQFYNDQSQAVTGTIATKGASDVTADGPTVAVPPGYYPQAVNKTVSDPDLVPGNIKAGVDIFGVTGTFAGGLPDNVRTITLTADPPEGGTVSGGGVAQDGMTVTVSAQPTGDYKSVSWEENGQTVSQKTQYTFPISGNTSLTASFSTTPISRLPDGYTELQYVSVNSATLLWSGITCYTAQTRVVMDVVFTTLESSSKYLFYAAKNSTSGPNVFVGFTSISTKSISVMFGYNPGNIGNTTINRDMEQDKRYLIDVDSPNKTLKVDDDIYSISPYLAGNYDAGNLLVGGMPSSTSYNSIPMNIYSMKIYRSGALVGDFVPCIKDGGGPAGLYNITTQLELTEEERFRTATSGVVNPGPAV